MWLDVRLYVNPDIDNGKIIVKLVWVTIHKRVGVTP